MGYVAVFEKGDHGRVLEVCSTEQGSLIAMQAYGGDATRARCGEDVFIAYSSGQEITREYDVVEGKVVGRFVIH